MQTLEDKKEIKLIIDLELDTKIDLIMATSAYLERLIPKEVFMMIIRKLGPEVTSVFIPVPSDYILLAAIVALRQVLSNPRSLLYIDKLITEIESEPDLNFYIELIDKYNLNIE